MSKFGANKLTSSAACAKFHKYKFSNERKRQGNYIMKYARTAVFERHFSFVLATIVCILILVSLSGCDTQNMKDLLNSTDCTITFVLNNGEDNVVWRKGDKVPAPSKKDYEFLYWCSDSDLTTRADIDFDNFVLASNITVYAKWKELDDLSSVKFDSVECYYDGNAHEVKVDESTLPDGALVTYDKQTSYVDAGEYVVTATIKADGYKDLVLSATVKIKKAILQGITFDAVVIDWDGQLHGAFIEYEKGELPSGVSVTYVGNGQRDVGVYDITAKFETSENYEPIADMNTTLTINEKYFSVTFDDGISQPVVRVVAHGQSLEDIPEPSAKTGYDGAWDRTNFENILEDVTVRANYTPHEYTVTFVSAGETVATKNYNIETAITFDDANREHYIFEGWFASEIFSGNSETGIAIGNYGDKTYYAKWRAVEYYVTYHVFGGLNSINNTNCDGKYKYTVESEALTLQTPTKKFYVFEGWYIDENFEGESFAELKKGTSGNIDLYAKWTPQRFEVKYDTLGGVNDENNPSFTTIESEEFELLPATKEDFDFVRWIDDTATPVTSIKAHNVEPVSLTAVWRAKVYTVEYETNGGIATANKTSYTATDGTITLGESKKKGYVFDGWYENEDLSGEKVDEIDCSERRNITLYAAWKLEKYSIAYDLAGGKNNPNPNSYTIESDDIVLLAPIKDGYSFDGWFDEEGNEVEKIAKGSVDNVSLSASWSIVEYTVTFDSKGGNKINPYIYTVESEDYTLPSASRNYYDFAGWFDENGNKVVKIESAMLKSFTLTAKWSAHIYTITYDYNGGTQVDNPTSYTVETETFVLAEPTKEGYTFDGWFNGELKVTQIEKGCHADIKLTAKWSATEYIVTFDSNGGDEVNPYIYTGESDNYTLPSANRNYYDFVGWFDENGKQVKTIESSMLKSFTLTAKWAAHVYTITYDFNGGAEVKNPTSYTVETETFALAEPTREGYTFEGWYSGNIKVAQIEKGSHADIDLVAKWKEGVVVLPSDFTVENGTLTAYKGNDTTIVVHATEAGQKIRSIAKTAFDSVRTSVIEIVIEEGVESFEKGTFDGMSNLVTLSLPSTITVMYKGMLTDCKSLTNLTIPFASFAVENASDSDVSNIATIYKKDITENFVVGFTYLFGTPEDATEYTKVLGYRINGTGVNRYSEVDAYIPSSLGNLTVLGGDIMDKGFCGISMIESLTYGGEYLGNLVFKNCTELKTLYILNENATFHKSAFAGCQNLTIYVATKTQKTKVDELINGLTNVICEVASN